VNVPKISDFDFSIGAKKIDDRPAAYVGDLVAKVVLPGTSEPEVVQTIGEIGPAVVIAPRDPNPQPAEPGSWPPSPETVKKQELAGALKAISAGQLWSVVKAKAVPAKANGPEIF
jgi:hypothetical protein